MKQKKSVARVEDICDALLLASVQELSGIASSSENEKTKVLALSKLVDILYRIRQDKKREESAPIQKYSSNSIWDYALEGMTDDAIHSRVND